MRWYLTPNMLAKLYPDCFYLWWRGYCLMGNLFHILWPCSNIRSFWQKIFQILSDSFRRTHCPKSRPGSLKPGNSLPPNCKTIVNILLSAKPIITRHWKKELAPNRSEAVYIIQQHYLTERSLAVPLDTLPAFEKSWKPWLECYSVWLCLMLQNCYTPSIWPCNISWLSRLILVAPKVS